MVTHFHESDDTVSINSSECHHGNGSIFDFLSHLLEHDSGEGHLETFVVQKVFKNNLLVQQTNLSASSFHFVGSSHFSVINFTKQNLAYCYLITQLQQAIFKSILLRGPPSFS